LFGFEETMKAAVEFSKNLTGTLGGVLGAAQDSEFFVDRRQYRAVAASDVMVISCPISLLLECKTTLFVSHNNV
jgi:hypothetical protein